MSACSHLAVVQTEFQKKSKETVSIPVPFVKQTLDDFCGIASLEMIECFYQFKMSSEHRQMLEIIALQNRGLSGNELKHEFETMGFLTAVFPGTLDHQVTGLFRILDQGHPLIAMLARGQIRHYIVVTGYDPINQRIIVNDPVIGEVSFSQEGFLKAWTGANFFSMLALPQNLNESSQKK